MTNQILIVTNTSQAAPPPITIYRGERVIDVPVTAVVESVMNGFLNPIEEFARTIAQWDGVPAPLGEHPKVNGLFVSAQTMADKIPALFVEPEITGNKLRGKLRVWVDKAKQLGGDAWEAVKKMMAGEKIEVSTGYFADNDMTPGVFNGKQYEGVRRNIVPDHVAVLLHEPGACSLRDGCGVFNSQQPLTVNLSMELSKQEMKVYEAWWEMSEGEDDYGQVIAVYADRVDIKHKGGLYASGYVIDDEGEVTFGQPVPYVLMDMPGDGQGSDQEEETMDREEMEAVANEEAPQSEPAQEPVSPPADDMPEWAKELAAQFSELSAGVQSLRQELATNANKTKQPLVEFVVANCDGVFTADELYSKSEEQLHKLADTYAQKVAISTNQALRPVPVLNGKDRLIDAPMPGQKDGNK